MRPKPRLEQNCSFVPLADPALSFRGGCNSRGLAQGRNQDFVQEGGPRYPLPKTENSSDLTHYFWEGPKFTRKKKQNKKLEKENLGLGPMPGLKRPISGPLRTERTQLRDEGAILGLAPGGGPFMSERDQLNTGAHPKV